MARQITGIIPDGGGLRITFDDNTVHQLVWDHINGQLSLTENNGCLSSDFQREIIDKTSLCSISTSLWAHLFSVAGDHVSAAATGQIGDDLTPNTWTIIRYDDIQIENHGSNEIAFNNDGTIVLPRGEYHIDASMLAHRSGSGGADGIIVSIQAFNVDENTEIPFSFHQATNPALNTAPLSLRTNFLLDTNGTSQVKIQIRIQADTNRCSLGASDGKVPSGSQNHAGFINITRIG